MFAQGWPKRSLWLEMVLTGTILAQYLHQLLFTSILVDGELVLAPSLVAGATNTANGRGEENEREQTTDAHKTQDADS